MNVGISQAFDGAPASTAATNCSMVRAQWLRDHPQLRFDPNLGLIGKEDMALYRTAPEQGLSIHFSSNGFVYENQRASCLTFRYEVYRFLMGRKHIVRDLRTSGQAIAANVWAGG